MDKAIGPIVGAVEGRLRELEGEIDRLTRRAASASEQEQQDQHWELAGGLQREARSIRTEIQRRLQLV
jgi:hypothetical protein